MYPELNKIYKEEGNMARPRLGDKPLTAKERINRSATALKEAGGKMVALRLSPEANVALKSIMAAKGYTEETRAINETLIESATTKKNESSEALLDEE